MRKWLLSFLVAGGVVLCAGCLTIPPERLETRASRTVFDDVPVMPGMEYLPGNSFIFEAGGRRVCALIKYEGKVKFLAAWNYYKEQMAAYDWERVRIMGSDPITIEFKKGNERARLVVQSKGSNRTVLSIEIGEDEPSTESGVIKTP